MRYANSLANLLRPWHRAFDGLQRRRLNIDELSEHMRRDLGLAEGMQREDLGTVEGDGRAHRLDLLTLTPYAS